MCLMGHLEAWTHTKYFTDIPISGEVMALFWNWLCHGWHQNYQILWWRISVARTHMQNIFSAIDNLGMTILCAIYYTPNNKGRCPENISVVTYILEKMTFWWRHRSHSIFLKNLKTLFRELLDLVRKVWRLIAQFQLLF